MSETETSNNSITPQNTVAKIKNILSCSLQKMLAETENTG